MGTPHIFCVKGDRYRDTSVLQLACLGDTRQVFSSSHALSLGGCRQRRHCNRHRVEVDFLLQHGALELGGAAPRSAVWCTAIRLTGHPPSIVMVTIVLRFNVFQVRKRKYSFCGRWWSIWGSLCLTRRSFAIMMLATETFPNKPKD